MEFIIQLNKYQNENDIISEFKNVIEYTIVSKKFKIFKIIIDSSDRAFDSRSFINVKRSKNVLGVQHNIVNITSRATNKNYWNLKASNFDKLNYKKNNYIPIVGIIDSGFDLEDPKIKRKKKSYFLSGKKK